MFTNCNKSRRVLINMLYYMYDTHNLVELCTIGLMNISSSFLTRTSTCVLISTRNLRETYTISTSLRANLMSDIIIQSSLAHLYSLCQLLISVKNVKSQCIQIQMHTGIQMRRSCGYWIGIRFSCWNQTRQSRSPSQSKRRTMWTRQPIFFILNSTSLLRMMYTRCDNNISGTGIRQGCLF